MSLPITTSLPAIQAVPTITAPSLTPAAPGAFQAIFEKAVNQVETFRQDADTKVGKFLSGEGEELHTVVMSTQKAELSFELFQQVRNKVVSAYQEVMRMQM
jgi:flagellar hook-basal body complex protein FliE